MLQADCYIYSPARHKYILSIVHLLIIYILLIYLFGQCVVLLKPEYIQPHGVAWLFTLSFVKIVAALIS